MDAKKNSIYMKTSDKVKNDPLSNVPAELRWAAKQDVGGLQKAGPITLK